MRPCPGVHDPELADHFTIEVAQQRERQLQLLGEGRVGARALDAQAENLGPELDELWVVLTERTQLAASNPAEVKDVPQQDHWAARQAHVQRDGFAGRRGQAKARRLVANPDRWCALIVTHRLLF